MSRLVDYRNEQLNAMFDALPVRKRIAMIAIQFDGWIKDNGVCRCSGCKRVVCGIGGPCSYCDVDPLTPSDPEPQK